ncbi:hypothetical protein BDU57DRAFT_522540 [Ampelomyces quisqualis]|uniref:Uncharacterized protein n=1 Tax=Ampelomyces quisqualis TaxID=50730 RepID=A0A6A5QAC5_AMPQU|nr:hypothetical protein BDU57DRAFT_522540 [Ampelomyces quisqualis]
MSHVVVYTVAFFQVCNAPYPSGSPRLTEALCCCCNDPLKIDGTRLKEHMVQYNAASEHVIKRYTSQARDSISIPKVCRVISAVVI